MNYFSFLPQEVKNSDYCEYIRPPIDKYKTLQFGSFDEIKVCIHYLNLCFYSPTSFHVGTGHLPVYMPVWCHLSSMHGVKLNFPHCLHVLCLGCQMSQTACNYKHLISF